jgi:general secretion pathway protein B
MSLILDALKKLEQEKASSRSGPVDIVPELVKSRGPKVMNTRWMIAAIIAGAVAFTTVVTMFAMGGFTGNRRQPVAVSSEPLITRPEPLPAPQVKLPINEPAVSGGNHPEPVTNQRNPGQQDVPVLTQPPDARQQRRKAKAVAVERSDEESQVAGSAFPALKVSGIAWQDDRADRRAVVNGVLVSEGGVIEGARIIAIHQDKVRFSCNGRKFEVALAGR